MRAKFSQHFLLGCHQVHFLFAYFSCKKARNQLLGETPPTPSRLNPGKPTENPLDSVDTLFDTFQGNFHQNPMKNPTKSKIVSGDSTILEIIEIINSNISNSNPTSLSSILVRLKNLQQNLSSGVRESLSRSFSLGFSDEIPPLIVMPSELPDSLVIGSNLKVQKILQKNDVVNYVHF